MGSRRSNSLDGVALPWIVSFNVRISCFAGNWMRLSRESTSWLVADRNGESVSGRSAFSEDARSGSHPATSLPVIDRLNDQLLEMPGNGYGHQRVPFGFAVKTILAAPGRTHLTGCRTDKMLSRNHSSTSDDDRPSSASELAMPICNPRLRSLSGDNSSKRARAAWEIGPNRSSSKEEISST